MSATLAEVMAQLRAALDAGPTQGPWVVGNTDPLLFGKPQGNGTEPLGFVYGPAFTERSEVGRRALADAAYIAAANPESIRLILTALEEAQAELKARNKSPSDRLHNLCRAIEKEADGSEWSREEWEKVDAETVRLKNELKDAQRELKEAKTALWHIQYSAVTLADAQVIALQNREPKRKPPL